MIYHKSMKPDSRVLAGRISFAVLSILAFVLLSLSFIETLRQHPFLSGFKGLILLGLVYGLYEEWRRVSSIPPGTRTWDRSDLYDFLAVFGGAVVTFFINVELGHGPVSASGIVGILGAAVLKKHAVPIFCGSFVGMASPAVFLSYFCILTAGAVAAAVYILSREVFNGFGGKLGTIAFTGCVSASLITGSPLLRLPAPGWDVGWMIVLYSIAGATVTYTLSIRLENGPVMSSAIVGLMAGLFLPIIHGAEPGNTLAVMVFCSSFAGMSGTDRFRNELPVALSGIFCGLIFIYSTPYLGGAGGKLGTIAFGSVVAMRGLMDILRTLKR